MEYPHFTATSKTNTEFGTIRVMEIDGQPWFVGKDVAESLGYGKGKSVNNAVAKHVDDEDKGVANCDTLGGKQKTVIINESGLYSLIMSSKLQTAKQFKRWVTSEVLPSVRQNGGYIAGQEELTEAELMAKALLVAQSNEVRYLSVTRNNQLILSVKLSQLDFVSSSISFGIGLNTGDLNSGEAEAVCFLPTNKQGSLVNIVQRKISDINVGIF